MESVKNIFDPENLVQNTYLFGVLSLFLIIYGPRLHPRLPDSLRNLFNNVLFRGVIIFLVVYLASINFELSLMITIVFLVTMNILHSSNVLDTFRNYGPPLFQDEKYENYGPPVANIDSYNQDLMKEINTLYYPLNSDNNNVNKNMDDVKLVGNKNV